MIGLQHLIALSLGAWACCWRAQKLPIDCDSQVACGLILRCLFGTLLWFFPILLGAAVVKTTSSLSNHISHISSSSLLTLLSLLLSRFPLQSSWQPQFLFICNSLSIASFSLFAGLFDYVIAILIFKLSIDPLILQSLQTALPSLGSSSLWLFSLSLVPHVLCEAT